MCPHILQLNQFSPCHPARHPFTSRMRQWKPIKTVLPQSQLFGSDSANQRRLACAPDLVSGQAQPITGIQRTWCIMVLFLVVDRLMLVRAPTGAVDPGHYSECQPIRYIVSLSQTCRLVDFEWLHFVLCVCLCAMCVYQHACVCMHPKTLLSHSHNALQSYQEASLTPFLASSSSWNSTMGTVLPP